MRKLLPPPSYNRLRGGSGSSAAYARYPRWHHAGPLPPWQSRHGGSRCRNDENAATCVVPPSHHTSARKQQRNPQTPLLRLPREPKYQKKISRPRPGPVAAQNGAASSRAAGAAAGCGNAPTPNKLTGNMQSRKTSRPRRSRAAAASPLASLAGRARSSPVLHRRLVLRQARGGGHLLRPEIPARTPSGQRSEQR